MLLMTWLGTRTSEAVRSSRVFLVTHLNLGFGPVHFQEEVDEIVMCPRGIGFAPLSSPCRDSGYHGQLVVLSDNPFPPFWIDNISFVCVKNIIILTYHLSRIFQFFFSFFTYSLFFIECLSSVVWWSIALPFMREGGIRFPAGMVFVRQRQNHSRVSSGFVYEFLISLRYWN